VEIACINVHVVESAKTVAVVWIVAGEFTLTAIGVTPFGKVNNRQYGRGFHPDPVG
jgi:hypothetical protein